MELPKHKCGLYLQHNEHKDYHQSAAEWVTEQEVHKVPLDWESDEAKCRAIEMDEIWVLRWYPNTPICFHQVAAPTFEDLIEFAMLIQFEDPPESEV